MSLPAHISRAWYRRLAAVFAVAVAVLGIALPARAAAIPDAVRLDVALPAFPVVLNDNLPPYFAISPLQAAALARGTATMQAIHRAQHPLHFVVMWTPRVGYEVDFWHGQQPVGAVQISRAGKVGKIYTGGAAVAGYARGHYDSVFDSPLSWIPFGLMFLLPLALLRGRAWLARLDIAAVLGFGLSYALFDTQHLEPSVWLAYPPLLYLLGRLLHRGFTRGRPGPPLEVRMPTWLLIGGLLALVAGRVYETLEPRLIMDVGYASLIGAYKIVHGQSIYFTSLGHPDTYGPIAYLAYVPFELIWPLKSWTSYCPAVRAATITFDLLTVVGLIQLGRQIRRNGGGLRLGLLMAWLWAACPFTLLGLSKNTNDGLIALFMVLILLAWTAPARRGVLLGLATAAKFSPGILLALVASRARPGEQSAPKRVLVGFVVAAGAAVAAFLPPGGLQEMWSHTMGYQLTRPDVFSPWALHPALAPVKDLVSLGVIGLAVLVAFRPRGRLSTAQIAALAGALVIAVQLPVLHWFYLYIVWFIPFVLVAVLAGGDTPVTPDPAPVLSASEPSGLDDVPGEPVTLAV